jgi:hypothetical protein
VLCVVCCVLCVVCCVLCVVCCVLCVVCCVLCLYVCVCDGPHPTTPLPLPPLASYPCAQNDRVLRSVLLGDSLHGGRGGCLVAATGACASRCRLPCVCVCAARAPWRARKRSPVARTQAYTVGAHANCHRCARAPWPCSRTTFHTLQPPAACRGVAHVHANTPLAAPPPVEFVYLCPAFKRTVPCGVVLCRTVPCCAMLCRAVPPSYARCCAVLCGVIVCDVFLPCMCVVHAARLAEVLARCVRLRSRSVCACVHVSAPVCVCVRLWVFARARVCVSV